MYHKLIHIVTGNKKLTLFYKKKSFLRKRSSNNSIFNKTSTIFRGQYFVLNEILNLIETLILNFQYRSFNIFENENNFFILSLIQLFKFLHKSNTSLFGRDSDYYYIANNISAKSDNRILRDN